MLTADPVWVLAGPKLGLAKACPDVRDETWAGVVLKPGKAEEEGLPTLLLLDVPVVKV